MAYAPTYSELVFRQDFVNNSMHIVPPYSPDLPLGEFCHSLNSNGHSWTPYTIGWGNKNRIDKIIEKGSHYVGLSALYRVSTASDLEQ